MLSKKNELPNPENYKRKLEFIKKAAEQVCKDFSMHGISFEFSGNPQTAYDELFDQILPEITNMFHNRQQKFFDLLYTIDISQQKMMQIFEKETEPLHHLTHSILMRALQKVVFRDYFKTQGYGAKGNDLEIES